MKHEPHDHAAEHHCDEERNADTRVKKPGRPERFKRRNDEHVRRVDRERHATERRERCGDNERDAAGRRSVEGE